MNNTLQERQNQGRALRASMSVAAALCVLGLASLVFVHAPDATISARDAGASSTASVAPVIAPADAFTAVPSAESVFRGKGYIAPEEPIAQF
jgi:hypothetical protein